MAKKDIQQRSLETELDLKQMASISADELFTSLRTTKEGLTQDEAIERLEENGENVLSHQRSTSWPIRLIKAIFNPFSAVLLVIAVISFFTDVVTVQTQNRSYTTIIIILVLVLISGFLQFFQETRSGEAAQRLQDMVSNTASVFRNGHLVEIPITDIVVGDVIHLSAGDILPADVRILSCKDLFISQAALTGESLPLERYSVLSSSDVSLAELDNICLMGSNVNSGSATAIVLLAGDDTYLGSIAQSLNSLAPQSSFEKGIKDISRILMLMMVIMVPLIFIINGINKNDWLDAFLFSLSIAVGLTPELLPMIMTSTLAKGAITMSKQKTIVKNLSSIQSFGAMDILCTDKTGTLTEDRIILERYLDPTGAESSQVLRHAFLNSYFQTGLKNLMDVAIIARADKEHIASIAENYVCIDEIPFDFTRRRMSVVLDNVQTGKRQMITKGAVHEILGVCSYVQEDNGVRALVEEDLPEIFSETDSLHEEGLRIIAIAQKNHIHDIETFGVQDEQDMVLLGFVCFLDPPKASSKEAIKSLYHHGVRTIVLTGDNEKVAMSVCEQVGIENCQNPILGQQIDTMSDEDLRHAVQTCNLFAKLDPIQKQRIVECLQNEKHTVGYMGDGINDAPAMRQADVGISVDSAVDIAKETADIILLEKSLMVLEQGVLVGRKTFGNIMKYMKMAVSGNFGNMFSVLAASIFLPFLPMLPVQILTQNLLYDISQLAIPFDNVDKSYIEKPQQWNYKNILKFVLTIGPISSIFDILTFLVLWFIMGFNTSMAHGSTLFQTGWFVEGLLSQTLIVYWIRTSKRPFIDSRPSLPLLISTVIVAIIGLALPFTPIASGLEMMPLPFTYFPWLAVILICYMATTQIAKRFYIRHVGEWI